MRLKKIPKNKLQTIPKGQKINNVVKNGENQNIVYTIP